MRSPRRRYPDVCPTGEAMIRGLGQLHGKYLLHTVGPMGSGGANDEARLLASAESLIH
jgi:O-acetyl-ADP-ribose deacetylase (regulator of RNase III)